MKHGDADLMRVLILVSAGALLFVVLFPYTPTPIATTIGKVLVVVLCGLAIVCAKAVIVTRAFPTSPVASTSFLDTPGILKLICVRRR